MQIHTLSASLSQNPDIPLSFGVNQNNYPKCAIRSLKIVIKLHVYVFFMLSNDSFFSLFELLALRLATNLLKIPNSKRELCTRQGLKSQRHKSLMLIRARQNRLQYLHETAIKWRAKNVDKDNLQCDKLRVLIIIFNALNFVTSIGARKD